MYIYVISCKLNCTNLWINHIGNISTCWSTIALSMFLVLNEITRVSFLFYKCEQKHTYFQVCLKTMVPKNLGFLPCSMNPFLNKHWGTLLTLQETNIHIPPTFGSLELEKSTQKGQKPNLWMWSGTPVDFFLPTNKFPLKHVSQIENLPQIGVEIKSLKPPPSHDFPGHFKEESKFHPKAFLEGEIFLVGGWTNPSEPTPSRGENKDYLKSPPSKIFKTTQTLTSPVEPHRQLSAFGVWFWLAPDLGSGNSKVYDTRSYGLLGLVCFGNTSN